MSPTVKVNLLELATCVAVAIGLVVHDKAVRAQVERENSGEEWVKAAKVKEPASDGIPGPG